jgi:hypothetical protein
VGDPGYRFVWAVEGGDLWIREEWAGSEAPSRWTVLDADGTPRFALDLPARFTPLHVQGDEVVGRWLGAGDVNYVRRYTIVETSQTVPTPGWLTRAPGVEAPDPEREAEADEALRGALRSIAVAQEIHYSNAATYTDDVAALELELPEGVLFDIVEANDRGWTMVATHRDLPRLCGLGYGNAVPPGWAGGSFVCGR